MGYIIAVNLGLRCQFTKYTKNYGDRCNNP